LPLALDASATPQQRGASLSVSMRSVAVTNYCWARSF
jgi:hypothetical protein